MSYIIALIIMSGITYLIRMLPLTLFQKQINNKWIKSFLYYIPYAVLSAMTFPAIFYSTSNVPSAIVGMLAAMVLSYFNKGLMPTAAIAVAGACLVNLFIG